MRLIWLAYCLARVINGMLAGLMSHREVMKTVTLYHNPRCSKSRATEKLIAEKGYQADVVRYLETPPDRAMLQAIIQRLGIAPKQLIRTGEAVFKENYADQVLSDEQWIDAMLAHPVLIERPIVVNGDKAVIGRPPEKVLEILA